VADLVINGREFTIVEPGKKITEEGIKKFEEQIDCNLPTQLRAYYLEFNGGLPFPVDIDENKSVSVPLKWKPGSDAAKWGKKSGLENIFSINSDDNWEKIATSGKEYYAQDLLPFGRDAGSNYFYIGVGKENEGKIYFGVEQYGADIEGEEPDYRNIAAVAGSFNEFLLALEEGE
jgi:hypothetical protein